jgi:hypothetical protein
LIEDSEGKIMRVYRYDQVGFTLSEVFFPESLEDEEWPATLRRAGWEKQCKYGGEWSFRAVVYQETESGKGIRYVEVFDEHGDLYSVFVVPQAWPQFLRVELMPILQTGALIEQSHRIDRLANAVITIARHGIGTRIDDWDGRSPFDKK